MLGASEQLSFLVSYSAFALALAGGFYAAVSWFGKHHLSQDSKDTLTLWLWGDYESTWSHHFCNLFDAVFGSRHLSWQCFLRSSLASILAVLLLYVFLAEILGVMNERALGELSLWQAIVFGGAINVIPDYLSLFETRWLLNRFKRVQSVSGQLSVLFADTVFTGAIIWLGINAFQLLRGEASLTAIEMLALFSVFSVFFYSTFLTSVWAWVYCLSTWFMRLFSRSALNRVLDVENKPVAQVALAGAALVFIAALVLLPVLKTDGHRQASAFDKMLCSVFGGKMCLHIVRFTEDESQAFEFLSQYCESNTDENCGDRVKNFFKGDNVKAVSVWLKSCNGGYARGCRALGVMYAYGHGVAKDDSEAVLLFRQACEGGDTGGCANLGVMYENGSGVAEDNAKAVSLFRTACAKGYVRGCVNLGLMYEHGSGVAEDNAKAVSLYRQACESGYAGGCTNLGLMYESGSGVVEDDAKAVSLFRQACEGEDERGCGNLGTMYEFGVGVAENDAKAVSLYQQACERGDALGCAYLGGMYASGHGVAQDEAEANSLYRQACEMGIAPFCLDSD